MTVKSGLPGPRVDRGSFAVGFDLDNTLFDTTTAVTSVLRAAATDLDVQIDLRAVRQGLGPPLQELLLEQVPEELARTLTCRYRALYPKLGPPAARLLPGADEAIAAVREQGGRVLVVTGQRWDSARAHLTDSDLVVGVLSASRWGTGKAEALREHGASMYVGDHPEDIAAARLAGCSAVAVATGRFSRDQLNDADTVLTSLLQFPEWLRSWSTRHLD